MDFQLQMPDHLRRYRGHFDSLYIALAFSINNEFASKFNSF